MNRQEFERVAHQVSQQRQAELEAQKGNPHFQVRYKEEVTEEEIIWYRCKCGKAFSNEVQIEKPDVNYNSYGAVVRYYFEEGTVLYPPGGGTCKATCYECAEGS